MADRLVSVDSETLRFPDVVADRLASDAEDRATGLGAAVDRVARRAPFEPVGLSEETLGKVEPAGLSEATQAQLSATYAPLSTALDFASLPSRTVMPHRGAGWWLAPQNTMEAFEYGEALGFGVVDGGDYRATSDGGVIAMHDADVSQYTSLTGTVNNLPLSVFRRTPVVDSATWFGGGWPDLRVPTLEEVLDRFGGRTLLSIEPKDAESAQRIANLISARKLQRSVQVNASPYEWLLPAISSGATACINVTASQVASWSDVTAVLEFYRGLGITQVMVEHGADLGRAQQIIDAGFQLLVYGIYRQYEFAAWGAVEASMFLLDDPLYTAGDVGRYRRDTIDWVKTGTYPPGHLPYTLSDLAAYRGSFVPDGSGGFRWKPTGDYFNLLGQLCPVPDPSGTYVVTVPITYSKVSGDTSRWAGVFVCAPSDVRYQESGESTENGYLILLRANGTLAINKRTNGALVLGPTAPSAPVAAGATAVLEITITPTGISVKRDGGAPVLFNDTTHRGGYMHAGVNTINTNNIEVEFGAISVS